MSQPAIDREIPDQKNRLLERKKFLRRLNRLVTPTDEKPAHGESTWVEHDGTLCDLDSQY